MMTTLCNPYSQLAPIYDALFFALGKDYEAESNQIDKFIKKYKNTSGNKLLDLACGSGEHDKHLKNEYQITGVDLSLEMLIIAKQNNPDIPYLQMDMIDFHFEPAFDAIICLFSAIAYLETRAKLERAFRNIARSLKNGGLLIIEPWFSPENIKQECKLVEFGEKQGISVCRMRELEIDDRTARNNGYVLISQDGHISIVNSYHIFGLYSKLDFIDIFTTHGIKMCSSDQDLSGRGLYIGIKEEL